MKASFPMGYSPKFTSSRNFLFSNMWINLSQQPNMNEAYKTIKFISQFFAISDKITAEDMAR